MYCARCGNPVRPDARFCQTCGAPTVPGDPAAAGMYPPGFAGYAPSAVATGIEYAGFWIRFAARLIDGIVLGIAGNVTYLPVAPLFDLEQIFQVETAPDGTLEFVGFDSGRFFTLLLLISLISLATDAAYYIFCTTRWGQTLGKKAVGIKVVDARGNLLRPGAATVRWVGTIVSGMILLSGYLMAAWDARKQALHDKMAGSFVVKERTRGGF